jgi:hypothetical protein
MNKLIFIDTNILGMVTKPKNSNPVSQQCKEVSNLKTINTNSKYLSHSLSLRPLRLCGSLLLLSN